MKNMEKIGALCSIIALTLSVVWKYPDYAFIIITGAATLTFLGLGALKGLGSEHYLNQDEAEVEKLRIQLRAQFWSKHFNSLVKGLISLAIMGFLAWSVYLYNLTRQALAP